MAGGKTATAYVKFNADNLIAALKKFDKHTAKRLVALEKRVHCLEMGIKLPGGYVLVTSEKEVKRIMASAKRLKKRMAELEKKAR